MMRRTLLCCSFLLAGAIVVVLGRGGALRTEGPLSARSARAMRFTSSPSPAGDAQLDCPQASPLIVAVASDDTDDTDELSGREKAHAMHLGQPSGGPSRRATRVASSLRQQRLNTLNALCVRLQI